MWRNLSYPCWVAVMIIALCCHSASAVNNSGVAVTWGYKGSAGPEFWARLNPAYKLCGEGTMQSPIDIAKVDKHVANTLELHYQLSPIAIVVDGDTQLTIGKNITLYNDGHTIQVNFKPSTNYVMYAGERYDLVQLHFHSPSENQLNGTASPLEVHFVHQGKNGKVLVIGVLIKGGAENPLLQAVIKHLPEIDDRPAMSVKDKLNPMDLFPLDNDYYSFQGSLTTPPCSQGIEWVVMAATITASPAQIARIRADIGGSNVRAVQPLNKREITYSMEKRQ